MKDQIIPVCTGAFLCSEIAGIEYGSTHVRVAFKNGDYSQWNFNGDEIRKGAPEKEGLKAIALWKAAICPGDTSGRK